MLACSLHSMFNKHGHIHYIIPLTEQLVQAYRIKQVGATFVNKFLQEGYQFVFLEQSRLSRG